MRKTAGYLLGSLLLLLLLLGLTFILLCWGFLNRCRGRFFSFGFLLDSNKEADDLLGLDHVVFINLKFTKDVINLSLGHLAFLVVSLESLDDEVIRVISISSHLLLEHLDHVVIGAGTSDLTKETIKFSL